MEFFNSHRRLFISATLLFWVLTLFVAILPALNNQANNKPLSNAEPMSEAAVRGKNLFISNGCVACHTQQVRSADMDRTWGSRPGMAADYADNHRISTWVNTATLMGTERTGPDLTNIGNRQPSVDWNLLHLYNPRAVVKESIMPSFKWLFIEKQHVAKGDVEVKVPAAFAGSGNKHIIASGDALDLVAYLNSLKQTKIATEASQPFLYAKTGVKEQAGKPAGLDGKLLYTTNCQPCHQSSGEGLPGAFPPLKGSPVVEGANLELYVDIIMNGYDAREEFGVMPAVGSNAKFTEKEVAAIINHERTSWGNKGTKVTDAEIKKIMDLVKQKVGKT
ncbi:MAG: cbb3-type cytochrome c oxidase subunit II [Pedobacter sp.]|uniref:cytochrome c n=1 Tax=Pedobacter sp. TaxID=1411316 RepID=UPI0033983FA5